MATIIPFLSMKTTMKTTDTRLRGRQRVFAGQPFNRIGSLVFWLATMITSALLCAAWAADDHGDSPATATVVTPDSRIVGNIESAGDEDYFQIDLPIEGTLIVDTRADTVGSLLDNNGNELATDDNSGPNVRIERFVPAGTYYVRVRPHSSADTGMYLLLVYFSPVEFVGRWVGGWLDDVAVSGHYAYVADWEGSLQVIDVSDPTNPVGVGGCETGEEAWAVAVAVSGHYAYSVGWRAGLEVIDVSDPANPVWVGGCRIGARARDVAVSDHYVYVAADDEGGLEVIDVSNPANPVRVGGCETGEEAWAVALSGDYAYVTEWNGLAEWGGLVVIDVSDPANPVRVGICEIGDLAEGVAVLGDYAYVAAGDAGLEVIDVSDPANPVRVGGCKTGRSATGVAVLGHYAYVALWGHGLGVIDVSDPANPVWLDDSDTFSDATGVAISGHYVYVAAWRDGLEIFRIPESRMEPPRFDGPFRLTAEGFEAWLETPTAGTYRVEVSRDLRSWETLVTLTNVSGRVRVLDPAAKGAAQRFYRTVQVP